MIFRKVIPEKSLVSFPIKELKIGSKLPFDVYIKEGGITIHFIAKGSTFTSIAKDEITKRSITDGYVLEKYKDTLTDYLKKKELPYDLLLERPDVLRKYIENKAKLIPIDKSLLSDNAPPPFNIYESKKMGFIHIYKPEEGYLVSSKEEIEGDLLISREDIDTYLDYIEGLNIKSAIHNKGLRMSLFKEGMKASLKLLFDDPKQVNIIPKVKEQIGDVISLIVENKDIFYEGMIKKISDYYSYVHSINVAILCIRLALEIGLKMNHIERLAIGAILHDIGKSAISQDIVNKQGRLTSSEYKIFRMHVTEGEKIVRQHEITNDDILSTILQHHEKLSGRGYPFRLAGAEIKPFGRIISITDCYDSMTTNRPFRPANTPFMALSIISREKGDFDPDILKVFVKMLGHAK